MVNITLDEENGAADPDRPLDPENNKDPDRPKDIDSGNYISYIKLQ